MSGSGIERRPPLTRQVGWTLLGNLGYAICQWGMLIVLAKAVSPTMVGQFGLGLAIATPLLMLTNLQLRSLQATSASDRLTYQDFLGFRLLSTGLAFVAILAVVVVVGYRPATALVVIAVGVAKSLESVADTVYGHLQQAERMDTIAISMLARGLTSLALIAIVIAATRDVLWGCIAICAASTSVLFLFDLRVVGQSVLAQDPRWKSETLWVICRLGFPLGLASLFLATAANVPRYFLERWHGEEALGYFAALAYPTAAFSILLSAFGQAATPRMAQYYNHDRRRFWGLVLRLSAVPIVTSIGLGIILIAFGPAVLTWLYRKDYAQHFDVFVMLVLTGGVWALASVLGYAATASRRLKGQAPVAILICSSALVASALLVPSQGLRGAALGSISTAVVALVLYSLVLIYRPDYQRSEPR